MLKKSKDTTGSIDFETEPIQARPHYPPKPVGVSVRKPGQSKSKYYAFGHPTKNNCTFEQARAAVAEVYMSGAGVLCHNSKFDYDVAETHMGLAVPPPELIEDSMFLLFFREPHAINLKLKPAAERLLSLPPGEQDALRDWCIAEHLIPKSKKEYGEYICKTPGDLCGKYANGDNDRALALHQSLMPYILEHGMSEAYRRECRLLPILLKNEQTGICVDSKKIKEDAVLYSKALVDVENWIRKLLKSPSLNIDSDSELADAMDSAGKAGNWVLTATGQRSTSKENLLLAVKDKRLLQVLQY